MQQISEIFHSKWHFRQFLLQRRKEESKNDTFNFEQKFSQQFECKQIKSNASRKVQSIIKGRKNLRHFSFQQKMTITTLFVPKQHIDLSNFLTKDCK